MAGPLLLGLAALLCAQSGEYCGVLLEPLVARQPLCQRRCTRGMQLPETQGTPALALPPGAMPRHILKNR